MDAHRCRRGWESGGSGAVAAPSVGPIRRSAGSHRQPLMRGISAPAAGSPVPWLPHGREGEVGRVPSSALRAAGEANRAGRWVESSRRNGDLIGKKELTIVLPGKSRSDTELRPDPLTPSFAPHSEPFRGRWISPQNTMAWHSLIRARRPGCAGNSRRPETGI
jgi:hypothetical protein